MRICTESIKLIEMMKIPQAEGSAGMNYFKLWPKQKEFLKFLHNEKRIVMLKRRQVAGTRLTGADSVACAIAIPNWICLILSKTEADAIENLSKIKAMFKSLPDAIVKASMVTVDNTTELAFANGSRIISFPATRGCGFTADRVIVDEAGKIVRSTSHTSLDVLLKEVEPTCDKLDGQLIILGTANGYNLFEKYYSRAKKADGKFRAFFFGAYDDPTFNEEKRALLVKDFGEDHVKQEYPRDDLEAFLMSGRCRFNRASIGILKQACSEPETGFLEEVNGIVKFMPHPEGWLKIWRRPSDFTEVFALGGDTAEGLADKGNDPDYSTVCVLDRNAKQVAEIQCRLEPDVFEVEVRRLGKYYNNALSGIERNKDGLGVLKALKNNGYPNIYSQEELEPERHVKVKKLGWVTDKISKPMLVGYADELIRHLKVTIKSEFLIKELMTYVIFNDGTTGAEEGCHDDLVMAFMIALWMLKFVPEKNKIPDEIKNHDYNFEEESLKKELENIRGY